MSTEHREPSRSYHRITSPPRVVPPYKAQASRAPRFTYPPYVQERTGRVLTPTGGILLALAFGTVFWAGAITFIWWALR